MEFSVVRAAEEELLTSSTRHDQSRLLEILHPDFVEIGRSGRRWTRDEIVAALADEAEHGTPSTDEWKFTELGPDFALVTYVIRDINGDSRHSSIWTSTENRMQLLFHQGTFITRS